MYTPGKRAMVKLEHVSRHLNGTVHRGIKYNYSEGPEDTALIGFVDTDLPGDQDEGCSFYDRLYFLLRRRTAISNNPK